MPNPFIAISHDRVKGEEHVWQNILFTILKFNSKERFRDSNMKDINRSSIKYIEVNFPSRAVIVALEEL